MLNKKKIEKMKLDWNKKERRRFSTNEADAVMYEIAYNQAITDILEIMEKEK